MKTEDPAITGQCHEFDRAHLPGFESHGGSCGDVQSKTARFQSLEFQRGVHFEEMVVRAHLHRPISCIDDIDTASGAADVQFDITVFREDFTWDHESFSCT